MNVRRYSTPKASKREEKPKKPQVPGSNKKKDGPKETK